MRKRTSVLIPLCVLALVVLGCNTLEKEYEIVRQIQIEGNAKDKDALSPKQIAMAGFEEESGHIVSLNLSEQNLQVLSPRIGELKYLKRLELDGNNLAKLPDEIGNLISLEYLSLHHNELVDLPGSTANLTNLRTLFLGNNNLKAFPEVISSLNSLEVLSVMENDISRIPDYVYNLEELKSLNIDSNRICGVQTEQVSWLDKNSGKEWDDLQRCE